MSLINDALRRARQSAQNQPPRRTGDDPLQPVNYRRGPGIPLEWLLAGLVGVLLTVAVWFLWQWISRSASESPAPSPVAEAPGGPAAPAPSGEPSNPVSRANQAPTLQPPSPAAGTADAMPSNSPTTSADPPAAPPVTSERPVGKPKAASQEKTNAAPAARPEPPDAKPPFPEFKLQGLSTGNTPWARVNGEMLFVGDQIEGVTVVRITDHGVTVEWNGETRLITF